MTIAYRVCDYAYSICKQASGPGSRVRSASSLGWRYLKERKGRTSLTGAGIALGVSLVVGVLLANASTARTFDELIERIAGSADVVITPVGSADAELPDARLAELGALDEVDTAAPSVGLQVRVDMKRPTGRNVTNVEDAWLEGVDPSLDAQIRSWELVEGRFPRPGAMEIAVPAAYADPRGGPGLFIGDEVPFITPTGRRELVVSGVVSETGFGGRAGGGSVVVIERVLTSVETARAVLDVARYNTLALTLGEKVRPEAWVERHSAELAGVNAQTTSAAQQEFRNLLNLVLGALTWVASISLFIAGFLIYLTLSRAIGERMQTLGIMRAIGAGRGQVSRAVLYEATSLGVVSTVIGTAFGFAMAVVITGLLRSFGGFPPTKIIVSASALAVGAVVGVGTTIVAAMLPARRAARVRPAEVIRGRTGTGLRPSRAWIAGAVLIVLGLGATLADVDSRALESLIVYFVTVCVLLGSVLLVPPVLRPLAWLLGRLTGRLARGTGDVSVRHLVRERSRSAYTLGLIMVVLAGLFSFGAIDASMARATDRVFDALYGHPEVVLRADSGTLPSSAVQRIQGRPGVTRTAAVSSVDVINADDRTITVLVVDPESYFDVAGFVFVSGNEASARRDLRKGGILLAEAVSLRDEIRRGDRMTLDTSRGPHGFAIAGTVQLYFGIEAVVGLDTGRAFFNVGDPTLVLVDLEQPGEADRVVADLSREFKPFGATPFTVPGLRTDFDRFGLRQQLRVFFAVLLIAAVIGLLGLANTLAMSIAERVREIGVMRATGASRGQVRRMVMAESATLGLAAVVLALPVGWVLATLVIRGASVQGLPLELAYPMEWIGVLTVIGTVIAVLAALGPAWRAGRLRPAEALRFE